MAKNRYINTEMWDDDNWFSDLTKDQKLVWLYLLTNPKTNAAGIYKISVKHISNDTGIEKEEVQGILGKFQDDGKLLYDNCYIVLKNFLKHQNCKGAKMTVGILAILKTVDQKYIDFIRVNIPNSILATLNQDRVSIPYVYPIDTPSHNININSNSNFNLNSNFNINKQLVPDGTHQPEIMVSEKQKPETTEPGPSPEYVEPAIVPEEIKETPKKRKAYFLDKYKDRTYSENDWQLEYALELEKILKIKIPGQTNIKRQEGARLMDHLTESRRYSKAEIRETLIFFLSLNQYPAESIDSIHSFNQFFKTLNNKRIKQNDGFDKIRTDESISGFFERQSV